MTRRWVLASGNTGKLRELGALLASAGVELVPQSALGVRGPPETASTFVENALIKARHAARQTGLPALADDSGLCVDALGGAPGVHSARFAGDGASDADNIARLLATLEDVPDADRGATFLCVIVALRWADDPAPLVAEGRWHGCIAKQPAGEGGFGYDPVFIDPARGATAAQLGPGEKNRVSHRGVATAGLMSRWCEFADGADGPRAEP